MVKRRKYLAVRFDIDSVTCLEQGVPRLLELGRRLGVRFTFYANIGTSFNLRTKVRSILDGIGRETPVAIQKLGVLQKLTWKGLLKTVLLNPPLGKRYRHVLERIKHEGHELGLHGGTDHALWQHGIQGMGYDEVSALLIPAYEEFVREFGHPTGFACPGFQFSAHVFSLLDELAVSYSSDMDGEVPFRTDLGGVKFRLWQVPVNIMGHNHVPIIEELLAKGMNSAQIPPIVTSAIGTRDFSLVYGHPYVEGVRHSILEAVLRAVGDQHEIVTVSQYLDHWQQPYSE